MIGSHSSISAGAGGTGVGPPSAPSGGVHHGADEGGGRGIYIISDSTLNSNLNLGSRRTNTTISTASESLEMMTTASSSSYSRGSRPAVPRSYSDVIPEDVRGGQLPGAIPEVSSDVSTNLTLDGVLHCLKINQNVSFDFVNFGQMDNFEMTSIIKQTFRSTLDKISLNSRKLT